MTYLNMLHHDLAALRARRVRLRRQIEHMAAGRITVGDATDTAKALREAQIDLRATDPRWGELHMLLGKEPPGAPVKLVAAQAIRSRAPVRRKVGGYLTRDLSIEGRR